MGKNDKTFNDDGDVDGDGESGGPLVGCSRLVPSLQASLSTAVISPNLLPPSTLVIMKTAL